MPDFCVSGNLTADPELRYVASGIPVVNFTVAHTPRRFDRASNEWVDEETMFIRCEAWRDLAENTTESLTKGTAVLVAGDLRSERYTRKDGSEATALILKIRDIGPSLKRATMQITKTGTGQRPAHDPWQDPAGVLANVEGVKASIDQPPF